MRNRTKKKIAHRRFARLHGSRSGQSPIRLWDLGQRRAERNPGVEQQLRRRSAIRNHHMRAKAFVESFGQLVQFAPSRQIVHQRRHGEHIERIDPLLQAIVNVEHEIVGQHRRLFDVLAAYDIDLIPRQANGKEKERQYAEPDDFFYC